MDGSVPTLLEAVARQIGTLKSDASKVSPLAVAALKIATEIDGESCMMCERGGPSHRDSVALYRELRITLEALFGDTGTADKLSGTDEFTQRMRDKDAGIIRRAGGAS